ncbi:MAG: cob(I)yrinic acid a,c-diamide adenosyltransferase [Bacillota bacterium]|nr:cob(I)yrinic acid a,c-diamide adenosyltransferase [Bacillota bacterium]
MNIRTKRGDDGTSSLVDGIRTPKYGIRFEVMGELDELCAVLGLVKVLENAEYIENAQKTLSRVMAFIASGGDGKYALSAKEAEVPLSMEDYDLKDFKDFVLPGGSELSARLDFARTVCRRAERHYVKYAEEYPSDENAFVFLNSLSDALFIAARKAN